MKEWESFINLLEKHEVFSDFAAECIYAYLLEHFPEDEQFMDELLPIINGEG